MIFVCLMPFYASAGIVDLSVHLSVYRFCGHDILKLIALILLQIGKLGPWGTGMKQSTIGPGGQRLRSHDAEVRFGGPAGRRHISRHFDGVGFVQFQLCFATCTK